jgi:hypothetical protein
MTLRVSNSKPSTLADVIRQVVQAFDAFGDATPILVGKHYLTSSVGIAARVVFDPEPSGGSIGLQWLGDSFEFTHSCDVYIRAAESGDDLDRLKATYELADLVLDCIATATNGRIEWGSVTGDSPTEVDVFGAGLKVSFRYSRGVPHSAKRWQLPPAIDDLAYLQGALDAGASHATSVAVNATVSPKGS